MIDALSGLDGITKGDLLLAAGMPWSTYDYARKHPPRPTRPELWEAVEEVFSRTPVEVKIDFTRLDSEPPPSAPTYIRQSRHRGAPESAAAAGEALSCGARSLVL